MKYDIPDMNRDGKVDNHDAALFHEILDENRKETRPHRPASSGSEPWSVHHSIAKGLLLALFGGLTLLCLGVFPLNGFTVVLALLSAVCFVRTLLL